MQYIITTTITTVTGIVIGILVNQIKHQYNNMQKGKENTEIQNEALKHLLKSNLVNQYYVYKDIGKAPRYIKESWDDMYNSYIKLGGNSFIKNDIKPKWDSLESYEG